MQGSNKNPLKNPDGTAAALQNVSGIAFKTNASLLSNGSYVSPWVSYDQYSSGSTIIFADVMSAVGGLKYEYSADGGATVLDTINVSFVTLNDFRVAIFPLGKGTHIRITYTNGSVSQTKFYFSLSLSLDLVNSMGSVFSPVNTSNIASITKTFLQVPDTNIVSGVYDFITRTENSLNTSDLSNGSITGGLAGTKSALAGSVFNSSPPVLTNGQQVGIQSDINGNLKVSDSQNRDVFITGAATATLGNNIFNSVASANNINVLTQSVGVTYRSFSTQIIGNSGITAGEIVFEHSNNGVNFVPLNVYNQATRTYTNTPITISANTNNYFSGTADFIFIRCKISTAFVGGTVQTITKLLTTEFNSTVALPLTTGNGLVTTNTERVVIANRVELMGGSISSTADYVPFPGQRIRSLVFTNTTISTVFLQIHNKTSSLITGDIPLNGLIFRIPANSTLDKTTADFGETGILYGNNIRVGLSSTFDTFTAISPLGTSINIITVI